MKDRSQRQPVPKAALAGFTPVPRRPRHDGWTPERQKAFVAALADTGCVAIAARMVNMSPESAYMLRRQPGAASFLRAWEAAQGLGLQVVRDEAFERAMHGQLVPVFVAGKLMGFRRKKNDRLLMFILRHYGQDAEGRKVTVNYFSTRATAAAAASPPREGERERDPARQGGGSPEPRAASLAAAEASATAVRTIIAGPAAGAAPSPLAADPEAADLLNAFEGVALDAEAQQEIARALEACAARRRALEVDYDTPLPDRLARQAEDEQCDFIRVAPGSVEYLGELESGAGEEFVPFNEGEPPWEQIGAPLPQWFREWTRDQGAECAAIGEQGEERPLLGQPAPEATGLTAPTRVGAGPLTSSSSPAHPGRGAGEAEGRVEGPAHPERGQSKVERRVEGPAPPGLRRSGRALPAPRTAEGTQDTDPGPKPPRKAQRPKPPFAPLDPGENEGAYREAEARARAEVAADRRKAAKAEAGRRAERKARGKGDVG